MPLGPQLRAILDTFQSNGLLPLVRGDAAETRARYRQLALSRRSPQYLPEPATCAGRYSRYCSTPPTASPFDLPAAGRCRSGGGTG